jgi:hypothetical protein
MYFALVFSFMRGPLFISILFLALLGAVVYCLGLYRLTDIALYAGFDTLSYLDASNQLNTAHTFHPTRCVAYPILLLLAQRVFSNGPYFFYVLYMLQAVMLWYVVLLQYRWLKAIISEQSALVLTVLGLCNVSLFLYASFLLTEIPCLFFIALSFENTRHFLLHNKQQSLFAAAFLFGVAILFKPGLFPYLCIVGVLLLLRALFNKFSYKLVMIFFFGALIPLSIQFLGMYQSYGSFKLSYISDITYYRYWHTSVLSLHQKKDILPLMYTRDSLVYAISTSPYSAFTYNDFSTAVAQERSFLLQHHPGLMGKSFLMNLFSNFHTGNTIPKALPNNIAQTAHWPRLFFNITRVFNMVYIVVLLSIAFFAFRKRKAVIPSKPYAVLALILLTFSLFAFLISGVSFYQGDRFNVIWMPFLIPIMAMMFTQFSVKKHPASK